MEVKKPSSFERQMYLLKERGFIIDDEAACLDLLHRVNYYALTAYLLPFKLTNDSYIQGIKFTDIERIYEFDKKLRVLIFSFVEEIELYLRTQLSYYHAHKYGSLGYLEKDIYITISMTIQSSYLN